MTVYKVRSGMEITIRKAALVQPNDEITRLGSGVIFEAETVGVPTSNTHWVRVTKCDSNPKAVTYYGAIMYPNSVLIGKIFADVIEETPPPPDRDEIVKVVAYFGDGNTQELFPSD